QFVFAGAGEREQDWRKASAGLTNVVFTGWLSGTSVAALMQISGVALAAYSVEAPQGLPNKIFEYMSAGLPIVSSLRGDAENLLVSSECGVTYDPTNPEALCTALRALVEDEENRRAMGARARARFEAEFGAQTVYDRLADHLVVMSQTWQP
ncbi:MAG: glycosyltransferase, partial [Gammaproteobacteria bacterium]